MEGDASNTWPRYPILTRGNFLPLSFGILNDILEFLSEFVEVTDVDLIEYQLLVLWPTLRCLSVSSKLMPIRMNINNNTLNYNVNYFNIWISNGRKIYINIWVIELFITGMRCFLLSISIKNWWFERKTRNILFGRKTLSKLVLIRLSVC